MLRAIGIGMVSLLLLAFSLGSSLEEFIFPSHFPEPVYSFENNPLTAEKIELGRLLFYDPVLSRDSSFSCASCHSPFNAFAHSDHDLSHGIDDQIGTRNAPALFNLAWQKKFLWDGAINHLDRQALAPINDSTEMGETTAGVIAKLNRSKFYPKLFQSAFGDSTVTGENMLKAMAQFQLTLVSSNSKYDRVMLAGSAGHTSDSFTEKEERGYRLYKMHCSSCHQEPLFSSYEFASNGLPIDTSLNDFGRGAITGLSADSLQFKIPSLRNLSFTAPYMHDGRFRRLKEVVQHYTSGIVKHKQLSQELSKPISISRDEQTELIAFLLCLNDREFVFDTKHQFPRYILESNE
ncbi:c-type cytochrome [Chitinophagales bacterium]|nr:c-type cytochrome [Chitinophagales bacterium]